MGPVDNDAGLSFGFSIKRASGIQMHASPHNGQAIAECPEKHQARAGGQLQETNQNPTRYALCFASQRRAKFTESPQHWRTGSALPMISRSRFIITAAFVCHLLLSPRLVTSQLQSSANQTIVPASSSSPNLAPASAEQEVRIQAVQQEKDGTIYKMQGQAEIHYRSYILHADEITYNSDTSDATVKGNVVLEGGPSDEHITASHGTYNLRGESGKFYDVVGSIGLRVRGSTTMFTSSSPFIFAGKMVEKAGPDHFVVNDGSVTTCELPHPKWTFNAHKVVVEVGGNAQVYRSTFRVRGVPAFFFPYAAFPAERLARKSGFLIPSFGRSSSKGTILGDAFYWVINRSMDATIGAEYFSQRGWSQRGEFRARPSESSYADLTYFGVVDREHQGGQEAHLNAEGSFPGNFRAVANIDYLSSFVFRLAFGETFTQAVNSEVKSQAFLSNTTNGFSYNALVQRYQNFQSTNTGDVITILHAPSFQFATVDRQLWHWPLYWSMDAAGEGLSRSEPSFSTADLVGRFDLQPTISMPLLWRGWSLRPAFSLRTTVYTQRLVPNSSLGTADSDPINRKALEGQVELRPPPVARVFERPVFGKKWKHVVEPYATYRYVTGVDNFANLLRFDARDILSNTHEVEYGVVNRLYAKSVTEQPEDCSVEGMNSLRLGAPGDPRQPWERTYAPEPTPCPKGSQAREIVSWTLAQKYFIDPTFDGAVVAGQRNVLTTTADLTGTAFLTEPRHLSPLISRVRVQTGYRTDAEWDLDYDFQARAINSSTVLLNYHFGLFSFGGGDAYVSAPRNAESVATFPEEFNQFRLLFGYGSPNRRGLSGALSFGFDSNLGFLQYATAQTNYNWDCCGISLEYRRFALGSVRNENQYRFNFTLSNIGSFGNLRKQERLY
jgi:LPS-assembly protein